MVTIAGMHDSPAISPDFKDSSDHVIEQLPKVVLCENFSVADGADELAKLTQAVRAHVEKAREDGVVYLELAVDAANEDEITAVAEGVLVEGIDARILLNIDSADSTVLQLCELASAWHKKNPTVLAGVVLRSGTAAEFAEAASFLRREWVPFVVALGPEAEVDDVARAVQAGACRLGHPAGLVDDFTADISGIHPGVVSGWVRDRHIAVDVAPAFEVETGYFEDISDHSLPLLQQLGFTCTVSAGDRAVTTLTQQFIQLSTAFGYGLEEFFDLTVKAVEASFMNQEERQQVLDTEILPAYEKLSDAVFNEDDSVPDTVADAAAAHGDKDS